MTGLPPARRALLLLTAGAGLLVVAHILDGWAYRSLVVEGVNSKDWGRLLRIMGFAPTWLAIAGAVWLETRARAPAAPSSDRTALVILLAVALGGLGAEALKLVIRRERPDASGEYHFRPFADQPWSTSRLGMPSSHVMVAFAGAAALGRRFPRAAPILYGLAAGCGLTRVFAHAHFLSDVVAAGIGGWAAGRWSFARLTRRRRAARTGPSD